MATGETLREFADDPFHQWLGLTLEDARPGTARVRMAVKSDTPLGAGNGVHGGILATLADITMVRALFATFEQGVRAKGTMDLNVTYLVPARGPELIAEASVLRVGGTVAMATLEIRDSRGALCTTAKMLYSLARPPKG